MISPEFPEEIPSRVPERTLWEFSALVIVVFGALFAVSWYRHDGVPSIAGWVAGALALLIGLPGLIRPNSIRAVFLAVMALTKPIGHIIGLLLLAVIYFGVMTPLALAFRLARRDAMNRRRGQASSYWLDHVPSPDVSHYLRQYQRQTPLAGATAATRPDVVPQQPAVSPTSEFSVHPDAHPVVLTGDRHGEV